jgi:D-3-phosphoglycerate dehydrogenase
MKILANDGISQTGIDALKRDGFDITTINVSQEQLIDYINENQIEALLVRSATTARKELIDSCPGLKLIGRGGVGMDNIDVEYAKSKGIHVINTPAASSASVAELVFAHLYGSVRFLYNSNRNMPLEGETNFKGLKKAFAKGTELRGKTLGIIGFGRIGQEVAKIGLGIGMNIIASDKFIDQVDLKITLSTGDSVDVKIKTQDFDDLIENSDFISLHVPAQKSYVINAEVLSKMKKGVGIINAARGGVIDEVALIDSLDSGHLSFAALDTFENEPNPEIKLLMHDKISLTPHIGAATLEAQDRIGEELASQISRLLK